MLMLWRDEMRTADGGPRPSKMKGALGVEAGEEPAVEVQRRRTGVADVEADDGCRQQTPAPSVVGVGVFFDKK
jgi:hypothetical protein